MNNLGQAIVNATQAAMQLGLDIRQVYVSEWSGTSEHIDTVYVVVEHNIDGQDAYGTYTHRVTF